MKMPPLPNTIYMDFDNTISDTKWNGETWVMGLPLVGIKEAINKASINHKIIIYTSRPQKEWPKVKKYLDKHQIHYDGFKSKPLGIYVDDRNLRPYEFIKKELND